MYNDTLKVENKIITSQDLEDIFLSMNDEIELCLKQYKLEKEQNEKYERSYQNWSVKDFSSSLKFNVDFYDNTTVDFDKYSNFLAIYNSRLQEIKSISVYFHMNYIRRMPNMEDEYISQRISIDIYETKMSIDVKISSSDNIMNKTYDLIKQKILNAKEKYDHIVKDKNKICNRIAFTKGLIPASIFLFVLMFIPVIRNVYAMTYVGYLILDIIFTFIIGSTMSSGKLERLYKNILPDQKYAGYDSTNYKSIYKDDIEKYITTSEILIGHNVDNIRNRNEIEKLEKESNNSFKTKLILLFVISILVALISNLF